MDKLSLFFDNIQKLKRKKRRVWLIHQIKDSETTASHIFRTTVLAWLLSKGRKLNSEKIIKMALIHDIFETFTFDEIFHDPLPKDQKKIKQILNKWPEMTLKQKQMRNEKKLKRHHQAMKKLIADLPSGIKKEMEMLWLELIKGISREARFVNQADKAENFLQALEYSEKYGKINTHTWIRWAKTSFDEPVFIEFEKALERRFFKKGSRRKQMDKIVDFLIDIGSLKHRKRDKWVLRKVADPEKTAEHIFSSAITAWVFSYGKKLNQKKVLKTALFHNLPKAYAKDNSTYYTHFSNLRDDIRNIIEQPSKFCFKEKEKFLKQIQKEQKYWSDVSKKKREKMFKTEHKKQEDNLKKLVNPLPKEIKEEIISLWISFKKGMSHEAKFVKQVNILENLFQAICYSREDKDFTMECWWVEVGEKIEDSFLLDFAEILHKKTCK